MKSNLFLLHASLIDGIGPAVALDIYTRKPGYMSWDDLYHLLPSDWMATYGQSSPIAQKLFSGLADRSKLEKEIALMDQHDIRWVSYADDAYPDALRHIAYPPIGLYVRGAALPDSMRSLALVGARKADAYGQRVVESLVPSLVNHDWAIISGGARGIDSFAHQVALDHAGVTVAVLGSGLLVPYPKENKSLFEAIVAHNGAIVSPFSLQTAPHPSTFPARNRIIAGMSRGCVVVQAAAKSGALITARFALDSGKEIFAVPGAYDHALSAGCHALIQDGAHLVTQAEDIFSVFGYSVPRETASIIIKERRSEDQRSEDQRSNDQRSNDQRSNDQLVNACRQPISINDLIEQTGMTLADLQQALFERQLSGILKQDFMGLWSVV